jgi:hypothetical protein
MRGIGLQDANKLLKQGVKCPYCNAESEIERIKKLTSN